MLLLRKPQVAQEARHYLPHLTKKSTSVQHVEYVSI